LIPDEHTVLQEGDLVHVIIEEGKLAAVEAALAKSPEES
jgi:trk system potassium uptake protein TrkA